jgi:Hypoxia induced protein conserved region
MTGMKLFLMVLLGIDMLAVVAVMLAGALGMASPGRDPRTSNKLMRWRVILQGIAIGLVVILMMMGR